MRPGGPYVATARPMIWSRGRGPKWRLSAAVVAHEEEVAGRDLDRREIARAAVARRGERLAGGRPMRMTWPSRTAIRPPGISATRLTNACGPPPETVREHDRRVDDRDVAELGVREGVARHREELRDCDGLGEAAHAGGGHTARPSLGDDERAKTAAFSACSRGGGCCASRQVRGAVAWSDCFSLGVTRPAGGRCAWFDEVTTASSLPDVVSRTPASAGRPRPGLLSRRCRAPSGAGPSPRRTSPRRRRARARPRAAGARRRRPP